MYTPRGQTQAIAVDIMTESDIVKYRYLADPDKFSTMGKYRIKTRGAFGTDPKVHLVGQDQISSWSFNKVSPKISILQTANPIKSISTVNSIMSENSNQLISKYSSKINSSDVAKNTITKSLFSMSNDIENTFTLAHKQFNNIDISTTKYWAFGTVMYMPSSLEILSNSGGLAFFVDETGQNGYMVRLENSRYAGINGEYTFLILKIVDGEFINITDSQISPGTTFTGAYGGEPYKIDLRIKLSDNKLTINCYINNFKIVAIDSNPLPATKRIGMVCKAGNVYFDYVYGINLTEPEYSNENLFNVYEGHYPKILTSLFYGNLELTADQQNLSTQLNAGIEEFGPIARELRYVKVKYDDRPAIPLYSSTGINSFAEIVRSKLSSYGAEIYVLNNSGMIIPLDDAKSTSFYVAGTYLKRSSPKEYINNASGEYSVKEPVRFVSTWIQKDSDAAALANWITKVWSKKQSMLNMSIFSNPLLEVGDIITVDYPYVNLNSNDQKFVVTNINHTYSNGLETSIQCRTL